MLTHNERSKLQGGAIKPSKGGVYWVVSKLL